MKLLTTLCLSLLIFNVYGQSTNSYTSEVPNTYVGFTMKLTKETPGFTPPVASRAFGYVGLTLFESVSPGSSIYGSLVNKLPQFANITSVNSSANYHWPTVANNALAGIIDSLWANASQANKDSLISIKNFYNLLFQSQVIATVFADSKAFGESIANDIFQYSKTDGGHQSYSSNFPATYTPPVGAGLWEPLTGQMALQPYWGYTRPFMATNTVSVIPGPPPSFSTAVGSTFYNYANQVYNQSINNTAEQITIAQYWADNGGTSTPPGHSMSILRSVLNHENASLETAAVQYAKMGMALSDAFKACWKTKFMYNCTRPISYINTYIDSTWVPLVSTPPFPEYSSGHSSQSGAMGAIMEAYLGTNYSFTDSTHGLNFGGPRFFNNFKEAEEEAAISRLYGGIHFEFGNEIGLITGRKIGANINTLFNQFSLSQDELLDQVTVDIYPNPAENELNIVVAGLSNFSIEIFNVVGQNILAENLNGDKIDIAELVPGMYYLKIINADQSKVILKNFVKK